MRVILFAPETFNLAETTRSIEVAKHLRETYECVFSGYSERYSGLIEEAGFTFHRLAPALTDEDADQLIRVDQGKAVRHPFTAAMLRTRVASELALIGTLRPAAVVIGTTLSQFVSARAAGVPLVYVKPFAYSWPHILQTRSLPLVEGGGPLPRAVNTGAAALLREAARVTTYKPAAFRAVAREHGVRLPGRTIQALDADLNLITSLSCYLRPYRMPANYRLVGPVFARIDREIPPDVVRVAEASARAKRPVVYFAMGSSGNREVVLRVLTELSRMPVTVIAPVASYLKESDLPQVADNIHVRDLLPAHLLGDLIDASVIHGGEGTVQTAVTTGKPFVGIGLQMEQRWNVADCARFGNAVAISPKDVSGTSFRNAVEKVLTDPRTRSRARALRELLSGVDGAASAAEHIHEHVSQKP
nr:nucleotide disphospho-sugar-binding domain-containing protein [Nocardiopsis dassonvillei]